MSAVCFCLFFCPDLFKNYLYSIGPQAKWKINLKIQLHKKYTWTYNERKFLSSRHKITLHELIRP